MALTARPMQYLQTDALCYKGVPCLQESRADSPTEDVPAQSDQASHNAQASSSANGIFEEPKNRRRRGRGPRQHA